MLRSIPILAFLAVSAVAAPPAAAQGTSWAGQWFVHVQSSAGGSCVPQVGVHEWYELTLSHSGGGLSAYLEPQFGATSGFFVAASVVGGDLHLDWTEVLGTIFQSHHLELALSTGADEFSGADLWTATGSASCSGTDTVVGSRQERRGCLGDQPMHCPCNNHGPAGTVGGCKHSLGGRAILTETGFPSITLSSYELHVVGGRPGAPALFVQGGNTISSVVPFKDGRICVGSPTERLHIAFLSGSGSASLPAATLIVEGNISTPGLRHYQVWYRDVGPGSPCGEGSNFSDMLSVRWMP